MIKILQTFDLYTDCHFFQLLVTISTNIKLFNHLLNFLSQFSTKICGLPLIVRSINVKLPLQNVDKLDKSEMSKILMQIVRTQAD